jgi:integrase
MDQEKKPVFEPLGEGFARKGNRIYYRDQRNGRATWISTKTNHMPLARKWKENWQRQQWLLGSGAAPAQPNPAQPVPATSQLTTNQLLDEYVAASHPIIRKNALKRKAPGSIEDETYCLTPVRTYFGAKIAAALTLADCDQYHQWRLSGGYVARFKVRGHDVVRQTRGGDRAVDLELIVLNNALQLAVRRGHLKSNPLRDRGQYNDDSTIRHCREAAPTPEGLVRIVRWMVKQDYQQDADFTLFLAYTGLRIGEALQRVWDEVAWKQELIHVQRSKKGVFPFVLILPELGALLRRMKRGAKSRLLFPSPFDPQQPRDESSYRRRLTQACRKLGLPHVIPHGLRSYFVTQARLSGLTDAEIAQLIGDKTGPSLIADVYGDVRPDHLIAIARKIRLTAKTRTAGHAGNKAKRGATAR